MFVSIYVSVYLSIHLSIFLFIYLFYYVSIFFSRYVFIALNTSPPAKCTCHKLLLDMRNSSRPLQWHTPELSSIISKKVVHNYLAFISEEKILSGIDIKGIVTSYI